MRVTGTMINYYFVCKRKLWLFSHELKFEDNSENVLLGKLLDKGTYNHEKKQIMIDETINIDFIEDWRIIHEVKKSRALEESAEWQVRYYIYYLRNKGIDIEKGILDYPKMRQVKDIYLTETDEEELLTILDDVEEIVHSATCPSVMESKICKKCAYFEYCYS